MSKNSMEWLGPAAQQLLAEHAGQQSAANFYEVYAGRIRAVALILNVQAEKDRATAVGEEQTAAAKYDLTTAEEMMRWPTAEVPLVPFYRQTGVTRGLWVGRLDELTGRIFLTSQVIVASPEASDIDGEGRLALCSGVDIDQFNMLNDQVAELDALGLTPEF